MSKRAKLIKLLLAILILLCATLSGYLLASPIKDEVIRNQGVMVSYATSQEIKGQERVRIIQDLKLHPKSILRIVARHYYGGSEKEQIFIQFKEPSDKSWRDTLPGPTLNTYIEKNRTKILTQLHQRMH